MPKGLALLFFLFVSSMLIAQSSFRKLSRPEKWWVLCHPCKAKKAQTITKRVQYVVDSVRKMQIIGNDENGGQLDAFKHTFWMASLSLEIGKKQALKLGNAHEKGNYLQYKNHTLEDAILPDSVSSEMDHGNNKIGVNAIGKCHFKITEKELIEMVLKMAENGDLCVIKKDALGNYIDCSGVKLDMKMWLGKWCIPKCLIAPKED